MGPGAIVITGGAGGMGRACARAFAGQDRELLLCDVAADALADVQAELGRDGVAVAVLAADLSTDADREALVARVAAAGGLAALAHTAGLSGTMADARRILDVNLLASARLLEALLPHAGEGTAAVCVASQSGQMVGRGMSAETAAVIDAPLAPDFFERIEAVAGPIATTPSGAYGLSKWGLQRLVVAQAPAWGARGARVVSLSPGIIDTGMGRSELEAHTQAMTTIMEKTPVAGRMGQPAEIASVVAFLCSEGASFVSGVDWLVDGGSTHQVIGA